MNPIAPTTSSTPTAPASSVRSSADVMANQQIFMKLLVAQIQHQNPMNPADGIEFMSQLTQFSQLEQTLNIRKELESIRDLIEQQVETTTPQP